MRFEGGIDAEEQFADPDGIDSPSMIGASISLAIAGWVVFMGMPIMVGSLADLRGYSVEAVGYLASAELGGMLLAAVCVSAAVGRMNRRAIAIAGLVISLAMNASSIYVLAYEPFIVLRAVAGFGSGLCYSITIANLSGTTNRARNFAYLIFVLVVVNAIELYSFPTIVASWGVEGIFVAFAFLNVIGLSLTGYIPKGATISAATTAGAVDDEVADIPSFLPWMCLLAITAFYVCIGGFWAFVERLGNDRGLSTDFIAISLSSTTLLSLIGCYVAYQVSKRAGQSFPLILGFGGVGLAVLIMGLHTSAVSYFAGLALFQLLWNAADIYQLGTLSNIDRIGRFGSLVPGAQGLGQTVGPGAAGFLLGKDFGYEGAMTFIAMMSIAAMFIYGFVHVWLKLNVPVLTHE